jgi:hypothetical protein
MLWWLNEHGLRRQVAEVAQEAGYGPGGSLPVRPCKLGDSHPWLSTSRQHRTRPPELVWVGCRIIWKRLKVELVELELSRETSVGCRVGPSGEVRNRDVAV